MGGVALNLTALQPCVAVTVLVAMPPTAQVEDGQTVVAVGEAESKGMEAMEAMEGVATTEEAMEARVKVAVGMEVEAGTTMEETMAEVEEAMVEARAKEIEAKAKDHPCNRETTMNNQQCYTLYVRFTPTIAISAQSNGLLADSTLSPC